MDCREDFKHVELDIHRLPKKLKRMRDLECQPGQPNFNNITSPIKIRKGKLVPHMGYPIEVCLRHLIQVGVVGLLPSPNIEWTTFFDEQLLLPIQ